LRVGLKRLPESAWPLAEKVLAAQDTILACYRAVHQTPMAAMRIRCHGNLHLEHVLHTGKDFTIIDFEGEIGWSLGERRIKRSPLRDVAAMIRSFHNVAQASLRHHMESDHLNPEQFHLLESWARFWEHGVSALFLNAYLAATKTSALLPKTKPDLDVLLHAFLLDQAVIEMGRKLNRHPDLIAVPLQGILQILKPAASL
jgi:maltose alpha-D-glucosyltransferase / alpha-amylase